MSIQDLFGYLTGNQLAGTLVLVFCALVLRLLIERYLNRRDSLEAESRRRIISNLRNGLFFLVLVGLMMIWAPALRTFALSLTAFAVAIILATKELILCISGSFLKTTSGAMRVGHWIEVHGFRGEVVDQTLLSTRIEELGNGAGSYEFTGRTIVIPNSLFLTHPVTNERFFKRYVIHNFQLVIEAHYDPVAVEKAVLKAIDLAMKDHIEGARRYNAMIEKRAGIDIVDLEPKTHFSTTNEGRVRLQVTAFLPTRQAVQIEQKAVLAGLAVARMQYQENLPNLAALPVSA